MDKLRMETKDMTQENIKKLAELFPNVVTEMKDENGNLKKGINFELLKQELSGDVIDGEEAYDFTWVGKRAAMVEANSPIRKTLRPSPEESKNWETTENLYIEGDNLDALKLLQESYLNSVKMIYIDPPYNTGNDSFVYPDNYTMDTEEYEEGIEYRDEEGNIQFRKNTDTNPRFHSDWCSMMYSRLKLAYSLLLEDGVIFISIDDREFHNLRNICDSIYGEGNLVGTITWEKRTKCQNTTTAREQLQSKTEYILVYKKQVGRMGFDLEVTSEKEYDKLDEKGSYREKAVEEMSALGMRGRPTMVFPIAGVMPGEGKQWKVGHDHVKKYEIRNDIFVRKGKAFFKIRPGDEDNVHYAPFWSHFFGKDAYGTAEVGKAELTEILGTNEHEFETVKPLALIKKLLFHVKTTNGVSLGPSDIVLDFFAGSSTTAHAVMELNPEDEGERKFIMVQMPEPIDTGSRAYKAGFKTVSDIGKERIRRAGEKIKAEIEETNAKLKDGEEPKKVPDIGFRVLKVDSTNMKDVYYAANEITQEQLFNMKSNIKEDRTDLDLLYGVLVDWGLHLSLSHETETIEGVAVHTVDHGSLIACFAEDVPETVVREIAKRQPLRVVFRDSSFSSSPEKINVEEIFKLLAPNTSVRVI